MVLLFKGIAPRSQFPATIARGAPPRPNHACFQGRVDACSETRWRSKGGRGCLHHVHYITPAFSGVPNKGDKIRIGCLNPTFWGAEKWAKMLHHPCILGVPNKGDKIKAPKKKQQKNLRKKFVLRP